MEWFLWVRSRLRRHETFLFIVSAILGVYLALAPFLRAANLPKVGAWEPWSFWFILMALSAVWVPVYALYKALDARESKAEKDQARLVSDLQISCQDAVSVIVEEVEDVSANELAAHVDICRPDGSFLPVDSSYRFCLRRFSPWLGAQPCKGKGVAGMAWRLAKPIKSNLAELYRMLPEGGDGSDARFNALPPDKRLGMKASELRAMQDWVAGVYAFPVFSPRAPIDPSEPLAIFTIEYDGEHFDRVVETVTASRERNVRRTVGELSTLLSHGDGLVPLLRTAGVPMREG